MKDGFIRVAAASPAVRVADCPHNTAELIRIARAAADDGVHLLVFPELALTACTCGDLFFSASLLSTAETGLADYLAATASLPLLSVVGLPVVQGDRLFSCAAVCTGGRLLGVVPKSVLRGGFLQESRHFCPAPDGRQTVTLCGQQAPFGTDLLFCCTAMPALRVAVELGHDLWAPIPPSCRHALAGATVIASPAATSAVVGEDDRRRGFVTAQSARLFCGYLCAGAGRGESSTDPVFSGHCLIAENGHLLAERPPFAHEDYIATELDIAMLVSERMRAEYWASAEADYLHIPFDLPTEQTCLTRPIAPYPFVPADADTRAARCAQILTVQAEGLGQRITRAFARTCVIGISGGLDSCLALLATVRAMDLLDRPRAGIIAVTMPCFGTTERTKSNAERLCAALGVTLRTVDITAAVNQHFRDIGHDPHQYDVVYENSQARERTQVIMDIANAEGGLVIGTGDLSELALGWATYNGDHMSSYAVNADLPKTLIRHIVAFCADAAERAEQIDLASCLRDILSTPVSPELLPPADGEIAQKTEDLVGPYALHDFYLYHLLRFGTAPRKMLRLARTAFAGIYEDAALLHWLAVFHRRFFSQQFKRSCLPDGPTVGCVGLSPRGGWQMPSDASAAVWAAEIAALKAEQA